jgi:hypothetical protein
VCVSVPECVRVRVSELRAPAWGAALLLLAAVSPAHALDASAIFDHKAGIWSIASTGKLSRWIVIHDLAASAKSGVFHIEVIGRHKGRPAWDIEHLCNHMAITRAALEKSVRKPLKSGAVYPESFDTAFARWQKQPEAERPVCDSSLFECLAHCSE